jgi:hypothetical protein
MTVLAMNLDPVLRLMIFKSLEKLQKPYYPFKPVRHYEKDKN